VYFFKTLSWWSRDSYSADLIWEWQEGKNMPEMALKKMDVFSSLITDGVEVPSDLQYI
jgi:hypothetical protein